MGHYFNKTYVLIYLIPHTKYLYNIIEIVSEHTHTNIYDTGTTIIPTRESVVGLI